MRSAVLRLRLTDFRSYAFAALAPEGRSVYLFGPNGAGKTNLLEALSLLSPGRGLRGAAFSEMGRRAPDEAGGGPWAVSVDMFEDSGVEGSGAEADSVEHAGFGHAGFADGGMPRVEAAAEEGRGQVVTIGVGLESRASARRVVRIDGEPATAGDLARRARPIWLTPAQDRLFLDGAAERRRFLDRLVFAGQAAHAVHVAAYERALRERGRLLAEDAPDGAWLTAVEGRLAKAGVQVAQARAQAVGALNVEIAARDDRPFPRAGLELTGVWERRAAAGEGARELEPALRAAFVAGRARDRAAGRALDGPHRGDLAAIHLEKRRPAAECSTGEQKALILNLILAQAARLSRGVSQPNPVLLLDEVAAHLDPLRRAALFDEIEALSLQAFLTGTDEALFETLKGRALGVHVDASRLTVVAD